MFISHLDLMRTFARAFRRAQLPISYSKGFNPHANMVFGLPLPVGVTSDCEYLDITLEDEGIPEEYIHTPDTEDGLDSQGRSPIEPFSEYMASLIFRLNAQLPDGIKVTEAVIRVDKSSIMSQITHASYIVTLTDAIDGSDNMSPAERLGSAIADFLLSDVCIVSKTAKKGTREINIRPLVKKLEMIEPDTETSTDARADKDTYACADKDTCMRADKDTYACADKDTYACADKDTCTLADNPKLVYLDMLLSAGSKDNLNPELLISYLNLNNVNPFVKVSVHRTGLFIGEPSLEEPSHGSDTQYSSCVSAQDRFNFTHSQRHGS